MKTGSAMSSWVEQLQAKGRYTFTRSEMENQTGRSKVAVQTALRRLRQQGRIASPRRGFHIVVPPEYRAVGSTPASWFIDDLMRYLDRPYYVGLLSAAAIHGAAHQQPMVFQVVTSAPTRQMRVGKVTLRYWMSSKVEQMPVIHVQTETGTMHLATPETTAFDLVRYPSGAGGLSNTAMVLEELAETMDGQDLVDVASMVGLPDVQRLGFLLDAVGESGLARPLAKWIESRGLRSVPLSPGVPAEIDADSRWHVMPNVELDIDS